MINEHYLKLTDSYLFARIRQKVEDYTRHHPGTKIIRLGIGDVTQPLSPSVITAMHKAVDDMSRAESFHGYGPEQGYSFLAKAVIEGEYTPLGVSLEPAEIFISDGSKCDIANIQEIFSTDCRVAIGDPVYPVYLDSNVMAGRSGNLGADGHFEGITYLPCTPENNFSPLPPSGRMDLIYLCSPNNPTGTAMSRQELSRWVEYARAHQSVILFDSAYGAYINDPDIPRSIYEIPGAKEVAIEFKSFSKTAGFTGVRCAFTVVPKELKRLDSRGILQSLNALWNRRQCTKFNGVSYIVQKAAEAVYSQEGRAETAELISYYRENARIIREGLENAGFQIYGGENAPYIWWKLPQGVESMEFLDILLKRCQVVGTPGIGFGPRGEGYFRLTAFGDREETREAVNRIGNTHFGDH